MTVRTTDLLVLLDLHTDVLPTFGESARALIAAMEADEMTFADQLWQLRLAMTRVLQWRDLGRWLLQGWEDDPPQELVDAAVKMLVALEVHLRDEADNTDFAARVAAIWGAADRLEQAVARLLLDDGR